MKLALPAALESQEKLLFVGRRGGSQASKGSKSQIMISSLCGGSVYFLVGLEQGLGHGQRVVEVGQ